MVLLSAYSFKSEEKMERRIKENLKKHTHSEQDRRILERVVEVARGEVKRVETMMEAVLSKLADR